LLAEMEKAKGSRGQLVSRGVIGPSGGRGPISEKTLADYGINYDQSSKWQKLAAVPEEVFEREVKRHAGGRRRQGDVEEGRAPDVRGGVALKS